MICQRYILWIAFQSAASLLFLKCLLKRKVLNFYETHYIFFSFKKGDSDPRYLYHPHKGQDSFLSFLQGVMEFNFYVYGYDLSTINFCVWNKIVVEIHTYLFIYLFILFSICSSSNFSSICGKHFPFIHWIALDLYWNSIDICLALDSVLSHHLFFSSHVNATLSWLLYFSSNS